MLPKVTFYVAVSDCCASWSVCGYCGLVFVFMAWAIFSGRVSSFLSMSASLLSIALADCPNKPNLVVRSPSFWSIPLTAAAVVSRVSYTVISWTFSPLIKTLAETTCRFLVLSHELDDIEPVV